MFRSSSKAVSWTNELIVKIYSSKNVMAKNHDIFYLQFMNGLLFA